MNIKTTDLCDACDDVQVCELPFLGYGKKRSFAGNIRTMQYIDGLSALREMVNQPGEGQVLVVDGTGAEWRALFGDVMAGLAVQNGWAGVVVNGLIRDQAEINEMDIGVKALGTSPRRVVLGPNSKRDIPVQFGGLTFTPGARLVADEDGVVLLPEGLTELDIDTAATVAATAAYAANQ